MVVWALMHLAGSTSPCARRSRSSKSSSCPMGEEEMGDRLSVSIRLAFIKLNQISVTFLSQEGKSNNEDRVAATSQEQR